MAKFDYEDKQAFTVVGIGVELKRDYMDQAGINKEKKRLFQSGNNGWNG